MVVTNLGGVGAAVAFDAALVLAPPPQPAEAAAATTTAAVNVYFVKLFVTTVSSLVGRVVHDSDADVGSSHRLIG
jgi:hypothetical protein